MSLVVILLGAPGSGKGTQAALLSRELSLPHVSTGDLFRANIAKKTALGCTAEEYLTSGRLVPDDLVVDMLFEHVGATGFRSGYLLDGFPRTVPQAETLDERLEDGWIARALVLEVPDEVIVERASGRLVCKSCGNIQHAKFSPPASDGVCDACGGELRQRPDDRPEVVRERLEVYREQTGPVVEHYRRKDRLCVVDGDRERDLVFEDCLACVR